MPGSFRFVLRSQVSTEGRPRAHRSLPLAPLAAVCLLLLWTGSVFAQQQTKEIAEQFEKLTIEGAKLAANGDNDGAIALYNQARVLAEKTSVLTILSPA
jgi:hypothetical protein